MLQPMESQRVGHDSATEEEQEHVHILLVLFLWRTLTTAPSKEKVLD